MWSWNLVTCPRSHSWYVEKLEVGSETVWLLGPSSLPFILLMVGWGSRYEGRIPLYNLATMGQIGHVTPAGLMASTLPLLHQKSLVGHQIQCTCLNTLPGIGSFITIIWLLDHVRSVGWCKSERIGQISIFPPKERTFWGGLRGIIKLLETSPWMFSSTSPPVWSSGSLLEAC